MKRKFKKYFPALVLCIAIFSQLFSQDKYSVHASQLQFEVFGPGSLFSFNIDSRFSKKENGLGFRLGLGGTPLGILGETCNLGTLMILPAGINYLIGKKQHLFEIAGGAVLAMVSGTKRYCPTLQYGFFGEETESYSYLLAGYRHQPVKKKGFTYRIFFSPLFQKGFPVKTWGGVSFGKRW